MHFDWYTQKPYAAAYIECVHTYSTVPCPHVPRLILFDRSVVAIHRLLDVLDVIVVEQFRVAPVVRVGEVVVRGNPV